MRLEEVLKMDRFASAWHKALLEVMYTGEWLNLNIDRILKPFGLSHQQYNVLRILKGQYPQPVNLFEIQERMISRMSNATRLVEKLRLKGLVTRKTCEENRRRVEITITKKGLEALEEITPKVSDHESQVTKAISEKEAMQLSEILEKIRSKSQ